MNSMVPGIPGTMMEDRRQCNQLDDETDSADLALMEMLGLTSFESKNPEEGKIPCIIEAKNGNGEPQPPLPPKDCEFSVEIQREDVERIILSSSSNEEESKLSSYDKESVYLFPNELSIPSQIMRRITDELIYGSSKYSADRSYETIHFVKNGEMGTRRELTRLENFVMNHPLWMDLCFNYIAPCISALMGEEMTLFKEKLNLKPPGGSGFAPHLDTPSLRVALGEDGPKTFVTVMIAIDDMNVQNGCLKVCKGAWSEGNHCEIIEPDGDDKNPDAEGRRGAIPTNIAEKQHYDDIVVKGGSIVAFNGWAPHRSVANTSHFPRRAVFLTYNAKAEGDFHDLYYERMFKLRNDFRNQAQQRSSTNGNHEIDDSELVALATIPRI